MSSRIRIILFATFAILLLSIPASAMAQDKVVVKVWLNDDDLGQCVKDVVTTGFNAFSKTAEVQVDLQPNVDDTLKTALAGGAGPDIISIVSPTAARQFVKADLLLSLDEYATKLEWDKLFVPWALELGKVDGKLYTLPDSLETMVVWYNKTLFEKNSWQVPKTMDDLVTLSKTMQEAGVVPFSNGYGECLDCLGALPGIFINHYAGPEKMYQALTGQIPWTDPIFVEAVSLFNDMVQKGYFDGSRDRLFTDSWDTSHQTLGSGEAAMLIDGNWLDPSGFFGTAAGNENDYDWFPIPTKSGEEMFITGVGTAWSINVNSKHPQEAAEYLNWAYSPAAQTERFNKCSFAFAPIRIGADALAKAEPRIARIYESYASNAAEGRYGYANWAFFPDDMNTAFQTDIQKVLLGTMTPKEYMQEMQDLYSKAVADGTVPPVPAR